jgi:excisionase family DNA binding protein
MSPYFKKFNASEDLVSQAEAARIRGVTRQAISQLIKKGRFRIFKIGGNILLKRTEVESYKVKPAGRPLE